MSKREIFKGLRNTIKLDGFKSTLKSWREQTYSWTRDTDFRTDRIMVGLYNQPHYVKSIGKVLNAQSQFPSLNEFLKPHFHLLSPNERAFGGIKISYTTTSVVPLLEQALPLDPPEQKEKIDRLLNKIGSEYSGEILAPFYQYLIDEEVLPFFSKLHSLASIYDYVETLSSERHLDARFHFAGMEYGYLIRIILRAYLKAPDFEELVKYAPEFYAYRITQNINEVQYCEPRIKLLEEIYPKLLKIYESSSDIELPKKYYHYTENYLKIK